MELTQVPPQDRDAERAVLSDILLRPEVIGELSGWLLVDDFCDEKHRRVYAAAVEADKAGEKPDVVTVAGRLRTTGSLDALGGTPYLYELIDATPAVSNVLDHARIVAGKARIRRVQMTCRAVAREGYTVEGDVAEWLVGVEAKLCEATQFSEARETMSTMREMVAAEQAAMKARRETQSELPGISTGFAGLDRATNGLRNGNKYVLGAVPGTGKTALALQIARSVAAAGLGVVFVSIEMPREQLAQRAIAQESGLDTRLIERGELDSQQWSTVVGAFAKLNALPIVVDDAETQTVASVRSVVRKGLRRIRRDHGQDTPLGLIVIDHLHIQTPNVKRGASRNDELTQLSGGNRKIAKEFDCPLLEVNQLNRTAQTDPNKAPEMRHLRECGAIEADAFGIFMLHRKDVFVEEHTEWNGKASLVIRKLRHGGRTGRVPLKFLGPCTRFYEDGDTPPDDGDYTPTPPDDYYDDGAPPYDYGDRRAGE